MNRKIHDMLFSRVYPLYIQKAERKGRMKCEVDSVIFWLTGYDEISLSRQIECDVTFETFFLQAPKINPNAEKITGSICGVRVEEIEDPIEQNVRRLDKLIDELAKGKSLEKVLRQEAKE